jgi:hypothetical protein
MPSEPAGERVLKRTVFFGYFLSRQKVPNSSVSYIFNIILTSFDNIAALYSLKDIVSDVMKK